LGIVIVLKTLNNSHTTATTSDKNCLMSIFSMIYDFTRIDLKIRERDNECEKDDCKAERYPAAAIQKSKQGCIRSGEPYALVAHVRICAGGVTNIEYSL